MIPNCNDGSQSAPRLRLDISGGNLDLPPGVSLPAEPHARYAAIAAAGFQGIQGGDPTLCKEFNLARTGGFRVNTPDQADDLTRASRDAGEQCATLHVGWGMESDAQVDALLDAVLNASARHSHPLYIETHRATITQDLWRTVEFVRRFPDVRFNGDFSHWYTGLEMVYGDFDKKLEFIAPVLDRVRFIHGRIGNPGCIQVGIGATLADALARSYVQHFMQIWTRAMRGFRRTARPGDFICFTPELLPPKIYYARTLPDGSEESDRWQQARLLAQLAQKCFADAA